MLFMLNVVYVCLFVVVVFDVVIAIVVDIVVPFYYYCFLKLNYEPVSR